MAAKQPNAESVRDAILGRTRSHGYGIGTKAAYFRELDRCLRGGDCAAKLFANAPTGEALTVAEKAAERELTWCDPGMVVEKFGSASSVQTPGAVADFDHVISSFKKDRDGDKLDPKGATLDRHAPLLWQHVPWEPVGKVTSGALVGKVFSGHSAIADTILGRDAATLTEFGALRISHGFNPTEWEPLDDEKGFLISKYEIMEVSLVSIPSNTDAVITQFSRNKLHHPAVKRWAKRKFDRRVKRFPVTLDITTLVNGQPHAAAPTVAVESKQASCSCTAEGAGGRGELAVAQAKDATPQGVLTLATVPEVKAGEAATTPAIVPAPAPETIKAGTKMKAAYLDAIKNAASLVKEAHGHSDTGLVPKTMCKGALDQLESVTSAVEPTGDEAGDKAAEVAADTTPTATKEKDIQAAPTADDLDGILATALQRSVDGQIQDVATCERLLKSVGFWLETTKKHRAETTLRKLFGI